MFVILLWYVDTMTLYSYAILNVSYCKYEKVKQLLEHLLAHIICVLSSSLTASNFCPFMLSTVCKCYI